MLWKVHPGFSSKSPADDPCGQPEGSFISDGCLIKITVGTSLIETAGCEELANTSMYSTSLLMSP